MEFQRTFSVNVQLAQTEFSQCPVIVDVTDGSRFVSLVSADVIQCLKSKYPLFVRSSAELLPAYMSRLYSETETRIT
jgi:hypothetical protein